jgi:uncharacterized protein (TIGR00375 family)
MFVADLHVHSRYSRATSREMGPEGLWRWAQLKGIRVIGTGDVTHPAYFGELGEKLEPAERGLYRLRAPYRGGDVPESCRGEVSFVLQGEVSSIYKKNGRTRKVHSIVLFPGLREAERFNRRLGERGNLRSDGRPIVGVDARDILALALEASAEAVVMPAHAWTPHFSVFGAASGFDSLEECYEDLAPHIFAIETGLSSDPAMNRRLSALDDIRMVSNSDAHSPAKLGREANIFRTDISYPAITMALRTGEGFGGTVEFFPEEGKYHLDGHRNCGISMEPEETKRLGYRCPACGRRLTVGVMHRVAELADRTEPAPSSYRSIIPLAELIADVMGRGVNTKGVQARYMDLISALGSEFHVLLDASLDDMEEAGGAELRDAIDRMRRGEVHITAGYDGLYGVISITGRKPEPPKSKKSKPKDRLF